MVHPLVEQLRFARSEFRRGLRGVTLEEAQRRPLPGAAPLIPVPPAPWG